MINSNYYSSRGFFLKVVLIFVLYLVLGIPSLRLSFLVEQRQNRNQDVQNEIAQSWGDPQMITGPILRIPYTTKRADSDGKELIQNHNIFITPKDVKLDVMQNAETRKRGIYEALLYQSNIKIKAEYDLTNVKGLDKVDSGQRWKDAQIFVGISDPKSVLLNMAKVDGEDIHFERGVPYTGLGKLAGMHANIPFFEQGDGTFSFELDFNLKGSQELSINPIAKNTEWVLKSDWHSPSFIGSILPESHDVRDDGFDSQWQLTEFNRSVPSSWTNGSYQINNQQFVGVRLLNPVNPYSKTQRSINYSMLIIALTFLFYFLNEIINKKKFHPVQYGLIGLALCLFYLILLSFSEHLGFDIAYFISGTMIISLISWYSWMALRNKKLTMLIFGELLLLYLYIFTLLQLEDMALLVGSIGLFVILALVMYLTRNINWYQKTELSSSKPSDND